MFIKRSLWCGCCVVDTAKITGPFCRSQGWKARPYAMGITPVEHTTTIRGSSLKLLGKPWQAYHSGPAKHDHVPNNIPSDPSSLSLADQSCSLTAAFAMSCMQTLLLDVLKTSFAFGFAAESS